MTPYEQYIAAVTFIGIVLAGIGVAWYWEHIDAHMYINKQIKNMDKPKHNVPPNQSER